MPSVLKSFFVIIFVSLSLSMSELHLHPVKPAVVSFPSLLTQFVLSIPVCEVCLLNPPKESQFLGVKKISMVCMPEYFSHKEVSTNACGTLSTMYFHAMKFPCIA